MEERFDFAIRWLKKNGQIKNAQEVAEKIGMSAANLSAAKMAAYPQRLVCKF